MTLATKAVWKWSNDTSSWEVYSPKVSDVDLATYAQKNGYKVLTTIGAGEGFWVQALETMEMPLFGSGAGSAGIVPGWINMAATDGWKLIVSPASPSSSVQWTAENISSALADTPPNPQSIAGLGVVETLWKWNVSMGSWSFHCPPMLATYGANYVDNFAYMNSMRRWYPGEALNPGEAGWVHVIHRTPPPVVPQVPQVYNGAAG